jgi:D-xylose transport system ATP-binding protein
MSIVLEAKNIVKDFPGVRALDNVSFQLKTRQIHALCGENGAGKSTLINILGGVYPHASYEGELIMDGKEIILKKINDSEHLGIAVIHQELSLFKELSVTENLFMGHEIHKNGVLDWDAMYSQANEWIQKLKLDDVTPKSRVGDLGVGKQQLIEIARALRLTDVRALILDEPTASLTEKETLILIEILFQLKEEGTSIIYVSHKLDEVMRIADSVTILRDGASVGYSEISDITEQDIIRMMVGREISEMYPERDSVRTDEKILEVNNFNVYEHFTDKVIVEDASFDFKRGEILGLFGLVGAGRTELISSVFGDPTFRYEGEVIVEGEKKNIKSPYESMNMGITYCTENRKESGIIPTMDVKENISLAFLEDFKAGLAVDENKEITSANEKVKAMSIKTPSLDTQIINLSGGNQQKVLLARNLIGDVKILILDEPTRGIDIGAKQEIYVIMNELVKSGVSIIMVSSELSEVIGMCDRIVVMHRGKIRAEFDNIDKAITQETIMTSATGMERKD